MKKRKSIESVNGEILLPEPIIQRIQSFLSGKEAAQTSILSKSWHSAWLTRPNLDFDQRDFRELDEFLKFAKKAMKRYEELNLKIQSFRLWMRGTCMTNLEHYSRSLTKKLIVKAVKMGVADLNFELQAGISTFVLPREVLGSETLVKLSLSGCRINRRVDGKVRCSRLKSLSFRGVHINGDIIGNIISNCPLIEELSLSHCDFLYYKVRTYNDVTAVFSKRYEFNPFIEFGKPNVGSVVDSSIHEFHKLKCLFLNYVKINTLFFHDFSSKFPCLKDLTVHHCDGYKGIRISSRVLEHISFMEDSMLRAKFDVSSICKFEFKGYAVPSLCFKTASREWESEISIHCNRPSALWFLKLKKLLKKLSLSKTSLSICIGHFSGEEL